MSPCGYLTFDIAGTPFAVAADRVEEVAEPTGTTRLPFSPPQVEGLANVAGRILPVLDITAYSSLRLAWAGGRRGGLLIVLRAGTGLLALRAGRIGGTLTAERVTLAAAEPEDGGTPVAGRLRHGERFLRLLDPDLMQLGRGAALATPGLTGLMDAGALTGGAADPPDPSRERASVRLLMVEVAGRPEALEMADLLLVFPVGDLRQLPHAPSLVRGVARVQKRSILVTDPLGAGDRPGGYAVVLRTRRGPVGVRVDGVRGVVRVPLDRLRAGEAGAPPRIVDYDCTWLDVRSVARMLGDQLDDIGRFVPDGGDPDDDLAESRLPRRFYRRFLTLVVEARVYALEFEKVRRVVEVGDRLRLPKGAESFDGLTDVDGRILPVLDLRRLLSRGPIGATPATPGIAILVEIDGGTVAVIADEVQRIRKIATEDVDPLSDRLTTAVIRLDHALIPVLRPEGLTAAAADGTRALPAGLRPAGIAAP
ncbi:chemotaxis protein CheW [Azospirillum sp. TSH100]|uniref:chemotaxis protein CheW n=1 Tax=Azospirillum sp. TSH100 TaxID=652764 RepID=UPI000D618837|nr:chemotaxis protein CheW [Azospirillum sp. TSH100]PWC87817.1 chemotaxis protein CheW [Azospirillum sp. TSH100]QCG88291.1 chemotaxis protein CheW [Azospirillum sp. TSH100]